MKLKSFLAVVMIGCFVAAGSVMADEPAETHAVPVPRAKHVKKKKRIRGNQAREKETEGTEAPNRFKADTVIRSQYQLNGKPLEVDPD